MNDVEWVTETGTDIATVKWHTRQGSRCVWKHNERDVNYWNRIHNRSVARQALAHQVQKLRRPNLQSRERHTNSIGINRASGLLIMADYAILGRCGARAALGLAASTQAHSSSTQWSGVRWAVPQQLKQTECSGVRSVWRGNWRFDVWASQVKLTGKPDSNVTHTEQTVSVNGN